MPDVSRINTEFEGQTLTTLTYEGRPCWIAREIGRVLGYSRGGRRLVAKISGWWSDNFIEGYHYTVLRGEELEDFKASMLVGDTGTKPSKNLRVLMLLFEPGLRLVCDWTSKPGGLRLRRFLLDEVLPTLNLDLRNRAESAEPGVEPAEDAEAGVESVEPAEDEEDPSQTTPRQIHLHIQPRLVRILDVQMMREQRLMAQHDLRKRMFQAASLRNTIQTLAQLGTIDDGQVQSYEVLATEIALGLDADEIMAALRPSRLFPERVLNMDEMKQWIRDFAQRVRAREDRSTPESNASDCLFDDIADPGQDQS